MLTTQAKSHKRKVILSNRTAKVVCVLVFLVAVFAVLRFGIIDIPTNSINKALTPQLQMFSNHEDYRYLFFVDQQDLPYEHNAPVYAVAKDGNNYFLIAMLVDYNLPDQFKAQSSRSSCYNEIPISKDDLLNLTPIAATSLVKPSCTSSINSKAIYEDAFSWSPTFSIFNNAIKEITQ